MRSRLLLILIGLVCALTVTAQERIEKRYSIFFRAGEAGIDRMYMDNGHTIQTMENDIKSTLDVDGNAIDSLLVFASTSPEGPAALNERLAAQRAQNTRALLLELFPQINSADIQMQSHINDWSGLVLAIRRDTTIVNKNALLKVLTDPAVNDKTAALRAIPDAYAEIRDGMFNSMRIVTIAIRVVGKKDEFAEVETDPLVPEVIEMPVEEPLVQEPVVEESSVLEPVIEEPITQEYEAEVLTEIQKPYYLAVKTNMLYDAALVPNIGFEYYLGKNISVSGNWMYAWWHSDKVAWYWKTYGGDLAVRYWFGKAAKNKPLTGHHAGIYGQMLTYDFSTANKGYLADKMNWSAGLEYGYALPIAKRLNIDFTLGLGYHWGIFEEYIPIDGHYAWQATKKRQYIGPTKLEVTLVWLLGRGNVNERKGGKR